MVGAIKGGSGFEFAVTKGAQDGSLQTQIASLKAAAQSKYGQALNQFEYRIVTRNGTEFLQLKKQTWFGHFKESHNWGSGERASQRSGAVGVLASVYGQTVSDILNQHSKAANKTIDQTAARALVRDIGNPLPEPASPVLMEQEMDFAHSGLDEPAVPPEVFNPAVAFSELPLGDVVVAVDTSVFKAPETIVVRDLPPVIVTDALPSASGGREEAPVVFDKSDLPSGINRRGSVIIPKNEKKDIPVAESKQNSTSAAILKAEQETKKHIEDNSYEAKIRLAAIGADTAQKALEMLDKRSELASYLDPDDAGALASNLVGPRQWGKDIASIAIDALKGLDISQDDDEQIAAFSDLLLQKAVHLVGETGRGHPAHDAFVNFKSKVEFFVINSDDGYSKSLKLLNLMSFTKLTSPDVIDVLDNHDAYLAVTPDSNLRADLGAAIGRAFADNATDRDLQLIDQLFPRPMQA